MNNLSCFYDKVMEEKVGHVYTYSVNTCRHVICIKMNSKQVNMYMSAYAHTYSEPLLK